MSPEISEERIARIEAGIRTGLSEAKITARLGAAALPAVGSGILTVGAFQRLVEIDRVVDANLVNHALLLEMATLKVVVLGVFFLASITLAVFAFTAKGAWGGGERTAAPKTEGVSAGGKPVAATPPETASDTGDNQREQSNDTDDGGVLSLR